MANDLNQCQFIGRLGRDPEMSARPSGDAIANFSIACGWKGKEKEGTEWIRIVAFNKLAEIIGQYCRKGNQIYISGTMRTRKWQDKDGKDCYTTEIVANQMQMLGSKNDNGDRAAAQAEAYGYAGTATQQSANPAQALYGQRQGAPASDAYSNPAGGMDFDDDIPF